AQAGSRNKDGVCYFAANDLSSRSDGSSSRSSNSSSRARRRKRSAPRCILAVERPAATSTAAAAKVWHTPTTTALASRRLACPDNNSSSSTINVNVYDNDRAVAVPTTAAAVPWTVFAVDGDGPKRRACSWPRNPTGNGPSSTSTSTSSRSSRCSGHSTYSSGSRGGRGTTGCCEWYRGEARGFHNSTRRWHHRPGNFCKIPSLRS
ncbi:unnamed protein product, partial [Laminaria digitata]